MDRTPIRERNYYYLFLLIFFIFSSTSCTKKVIETSIGSEKEVNKILIAADGSEYKDKILSRILENYKADYVIDIINIDKLNRMSIDDYSVVLIMDTCMAWTGFNPSHKTFLDNRKHRDKTVLFITAGDPDWKYSYLEVDAVTSASEISNEDAAYDELAEKMKSILSNK